MEQIDLLHNFDESLPSWTSFSKVEDRADGAVFENSRYRVIRMNLDGGVHLSIHDLQWSTRHDWRDFQRIKNELCGEAAWAVELYPTESQLEDTRNEYHLWVFTSSMPPYAIPRRLVLEREDAQQRPYSDDQRPEDCRVFPKAVIEGQQALLDAIQAARAESEQGDSQS